MQYVQTARSHSARGESVVKLTKDSASSQGKKRSTFTNIHPFKECKLKRTILIKYIAYNVSNNSENVMIHILNHSIIYLIMSACCLHFQIRRILLIRNSKYTASNCIKYVFTTFRNRGLGLKMGQPQVFHRLSGCFLLWMVLSCLVTVVRSDRVMWVDTEGEDGPQCIHHTPVGALMAQPPPSRSCRSLEYALWNALNSTSIRVVCGTYTLHSFNAPPNKFQSVQKEPFALKLEGKCATDWPIIQCLNGITVTFNAFKEVEIREISFKGCGEQEHLKNVDDNPALYFSNCTNVMLQHVTVHITGLYGIGIVVKNILPHGVNTLRDVSVLHNGTYGTGILCNIQGSNQSPALNISLYMNNVQVVNTNTHTEYDPSMAFTGIFVIVKGTGSGNNISLHNVTVFNSAPMSGSSITVRLLGDMNNNTVNLVGVNVLDGWDQRYSSKNRTDTLTECTRRQLEMMKSNTKSKSYYSVFLLVQTSSNTINITGAHVVTSYGPKNVIAFYVIFATLASLNRVSLENVSVTAKECPFSIADKYGLFLIFADNSSVNTLVTRNLLVVNITTESGVGVLLDFSGQCTGNRVLLYGSTIAYHMSKNGGGLDAIFSDYANNNRLILSRLIVENNTAAMGGGIQINLLGLSAKNSILAGFILISGNRAHAGGGMFISFTDFSQQNTVDLDAVYIMNNTLSPTTNICMGGGMLLYFTTGSVTMPTNNAVVMNHTYFIDNKAMCGVGGGLSLFYMHSPYTGDSGDKVHVDNSWFFDNRADSGHAFALQSSPWNRKALFRGFISTNIFCAFTNVTHKINNEYFNTVFRHTIHGGYNNFNFTIFNKSEIAYKAQIIIMNVMSELNKHANPFLQIKAHGSLVLLVSVQIKLDGKFSCEAASQGLLAFDSEVILPPDSYTLFEHCVASNGGAIALYGESYIRISPNSYMSLTYNHAFQRGGALYVHSAPHAATHVRCFLQYVQGDKASYRGIVFQNNSAKHEGQSIFISEVENCIKDGSTNLYYYPSQRLTSLNSTYMLNLKFQRTDKHYTGQMCYEDGINYTSFCNGTSNTSIDILPQVVSGPDHVDGAPVDLDNPLTVQFIPGKQKQLPHKQAYDILGNVINTVFTVQIITDEPTTDVHLNPFSKYTADFTVILHGIPLTHGMANHLSTTNKSNETGNATPRLVLQSVDNSNLMLIMNIELQCCPPGYIFRISSGDMGTCHCGISMVPGIGECNETDPNNIGAVLQRNHWAGYLPSIDRLSCNGQKFFSAPCPPGYCQTLQTTLPNNNSKELLEEIGCGGSNRKGLLCGDCLEGYSTAINFNGMRPVCTSCQDGLSTVGLLVWILSEWVPMLVVMFVVMLFNIDLVSGRFNSFLLFAQLLAFSSIRGDAELGTVHITFVKIYRFLYGVWNLDFFGVLLPPYCLIPHSHLTLLQTLLLHYSIGLFPLIVAITLIVLERSAEKWICCHRVDQCLRRMRRWKAKYSDGMSYDRALPAFVILGFTRFLVSSSYILVNQTITGEDGEERMVVWWQGSVPYGSIQHIAYFIPAIIILLVFVLLPAFLLLTLPIVPQLFGRLIIAVPPLRKLQRMQTFCSNVYTDRWIYHFVNVFQGCYKERFRSFSSLYLFYRIIHLVAAVFIPRAEDGLCIQLILTLVLSQLIVIFQPYSASHLNILDTAILGNLSLILVLSLLMNDADTLSGTIQFFASVRMILIYLPLLYPAILFGRKVYMKCPKLRCCHKKYESEEDDVDPLLIDPTEGLGNFVRITELHAGAPTSSDEESETETQSEEMLLEN